MMSTAESSAPMSCCDVARAARTARAVSLVRWTERAPHCRERVPALSCRKGGLTRGPHILHERRKRRGENAPPAEREVERGGRGRGVPEPGVRAAVLDEHLERAEGDKGDNSSAKCRFREEATVWACAWRRALDRRSRSHLASPYRHIVLPA